MFAVSQNVKVIYFAVLLAGGLTGLCLYIIEVDCSLGQFKSAQLKDKEFTKNALIFSKHCKKERDRSTKFLALAGRWAAVD